MVADENGNPVQCTKHSDERDEIAKYGAGRARYIHKAQSCWQTPVSPEYKLKFHGKRDIPMNSDDIATEAIGTPRLLVRWKIAGACPSLAKAQIVLEAR